MVTEIVDLDLGSNSSFKIVTMEGDIRSRFIEFHLSFNGEVFSLQNKSVKCRYINGKTTEEVNLVIDDYVNGVCTLEIPYRVTSTAQNGKCELVISQSGEILSTIPFSVEVSKSLVERAPVESSSEFGALNDALWKIDGVDNRLNGISSQLDTKANKTDLNTLITRMDTFSQLTSGSTTGDAELIDGRIGADGVVYSNIGEAIRYQNSNLNDIINSNFTGYKQLINKEKCSRGLYYNKTTIGATSSANNYMCIKLTLNAGNYVGGLDENFSYIVKDGAMKSITSLSNYEKYLNVGSGKSWDYFNKFTLTEKTECYLTFRYDLSNALDGMLFESGEKLYPPKYINYNTYFQLKLNTSYKNVTKNIITVGEEWHDFTSLKKAVESIKDSSYYNQYEIRLSKSYFDLYAEFGGESWVNSIVDGNEMQGLTLPDYVHLVGLGNNVVVEMAIPDSVTTQASAKCVSTINLNRNNNLTNIIFKAKNTRYVCHDETGNSFNKLTRTIKNCEFIHKGNKDGVWSGNKAYGGGTGGGGLYNFINCIFKSPICPITFHNNGNNQIGNYFNFDGCVMKDGKLDYSLGFGYYKKNTDRNKVMIKNCILDKPYSVYKEVSSVDSDNVWDIYDFDNKNIIIGSN